MYTKRLDSKELEIFASRVHALRKKSGLSQKDLGDAIGLSHKAISTIESGSRTTTLKKLIALAQFFQVSTDYLLGLRDGPGRDSEGQEEKAGD